MEIEITNEYRGELYPNVNDKFRCIENLMQDNKVGIAFFSIPELILLKTNQMHIANLEEPYNRIDQIEGKCLSNIFGPWSNHLTQKDLDHFSKMRKTKYAMEVGMFLKDGREKYFNNILSPVEENGEVRYVLSILMDVTDTVMNRKKIESYAQTIQLEKEELEAVIDNLNDAVLIFRDGKLYLQNQISRNYFGRHVIENPRDIYNAASYYNRQGERLTYEKMPLNRILNGESINKEDILMDSHGNKKYLSISGTTLSDKAGTPYLHIVNCRDATDMALNFLTIVEQKKQLDQELEAERYKSDTLKSQMQENEAFLSFISHEFRTPLTVINSAVQALDFICRGELPPKAEKYLKSVRQNTYRMLRLMNNILDLNRAEAGFLKTHSAKTDVVLLTRNIVDSVAIYAKQKNIEIHFTPRCKSIIAITDQNKYERILLNLLSNAVKFTPSGKSIHIGVARKEGLIILRVRDEGVGIPPDKQKELFKRYSQVGSDLTRPSEGAGIGLSLVKQLVKSMSGSITLKSREGKGSTFIVEFPDGKPQDIDKTAINEIRGENIEESARIEFS